MNSVNVVWYIVVLIVNDNDKVNVVLIAFSLYKAARHLRLDHHQLISFFLVLIYVLCK